VVVSGGTRPWTTLSIVHVRFEYACGHAALVSLPRIKAESPARRKERVSHEKAAAGQRSCDFCPPVAPPIIEAHDMDGVDRVAELPDVMPSMIDGTDRAPLEHPVTADRVRGQAQEEALTTSVSEAFMAHDQASTTPTPSSESIRPEGGFRLRKLSDEQEREVTRLYADTATPLGQIGQRFGIGQTSVARIAQRHGAPLRNPAISRAMASDKRGPTASAETGQAIESKTNQTSPEPAAQPTVAPTAGGAKSVTSRQRTAPVARRPRTQAPAVRATPVRTAMRRSRTAGVASSSELRQFVITFVAEQVFEAESALDALRQAMARGAAEVHSIVRIA
jgi:hypothetical protein